MEAILFATVARVHAMFARVLSLRLPRSTPSATKSQTLGYEKFFIQFLCYGGCSGRNGRLRPDKETGTAGKSNADGFAFRSGRAGHSVCGSALHAANHVRLSRRRVNGVARGADG